MKHLICALTLTTALTQGAMAETWPNLPEGIKNGIGVQMGQKLIVGLGTAGTALYALDLDNKDAGWQALPAFAGPAPSQPAAAVSGDALYVFSGSGKPTEDAAAPIVFDTVYRFDGTSWQQLDTHTPVGLLGASAVTLADGKIAIFGGYNKEKFDTYLAGVTAIDKEKEPEAWAKYVSDFMGMKPEGYQWNKDVLIFDPAAVNWTTAGQTPYLPNTGAAVTALGPDDFLIVNGEIKPGLRTDQVKELRFDNDQPSFSERAPLPPADGETVQEGVAGAYIGTTGQAVLVAGGANFAGARAKADAGQWYAHEGLDKRRVRTVFALRGNDWAEVGQLPFGMAYGASFTLDDGVLVVGGENEAGEAVTDVFQINLDGEALTITD